MHGEKFERNEARMGDLMARFNETIKEFQEITNLFTNTREDTRDRVKVEKYTIDFLQEKLKDQEYTIAFLKRVASSGLSSLIVKM
jgi:hypothetical protein